MRAAEIRRRKKRERELEFVDREKRNVEQVNLLIADMHTSRVQRRGARGGGRGQTRGHIKGKLHTSEFDEVDDAEDNNSVETKRKKKKSNNRRVNKRRKPSE